MTTTTEKPVSETRKSEQRLAIALGMSLSDGSPIIVGEKKCPNTTKIHAALAAAGWNVKRMTRTQRSDAQDDWGCTGRHWSDMSKLPASIRDMTVEEWMLTTHGNP